MDEFVNLLFIVLISTLRMSVPLTLVTLGAVISVRSGVMDLGAEGMMIAGSIFGVLGSYLTGSPWMGLCFAMFFGAVFSLIHVVLHVTYKVNPTISGMSVNLLALAIAPLLVMLVWGRKTLSDNVPGFSKIDFPALDKIPILGRILKEQNLFFFISLLIAFLMWIFLFKTKIGLRLRMVGENPKAANTIGINVVKYKYIGTMICGALAGLGGAALSLGQLDMFIIGMTGGRGYIAIVINAFGRFHPLGALLGSIFFGFFDSLQIIFQGLVIPSQILMMMPYFFTLVVVSFGLSRSSSPAGMSKHHDDI